MYEQNTSMMNTPERNTFLLPAMVEGDFSSDEIAEDADGLQMMSFQRVKIPAGGQLQFEIPTEDPDNPDYTRTLEGVILYNHSAYTLWPEGSEYDEDTKPLCSSVDGKTGIGEPGGACATCPMNAYGSARDGGRGKACKNMRDIYLLRSGEYMPLLISLPPTSIKPFKEFLNRAFVYRRRATYGSLIQIGLKKENNGSNDYSVATFRLVRDFQGEELAQIRAYVPASAVQHDRHCYAGYSGCRNYPATQYSGGVPLHRRVGRCFCPAGWGCFEKEKVRCI